MNATQRYGRSSSVLAIDNKSKNNTASYFSKNPIKANSDEMRHNRVNFYGNNARGNFSRNHAKSANARGNWHRPTQSVN